jgi:2',3'-cyclic-nucleotide 2'-phosphodiesterase
MRFLIFGDVVAKMGRRALAATLPQFREQYQPNIVIANVENLAHGLGVTGKSLNEIVEAGVTMATSGNHIWDKPEGIELLDQENSILIRPANYPEGTSGKGWKKLSVDGKTVLVVNLLGRVFMKDLVDCPFRTFDAVFDAEPADIVIVDFHGETTSERGAFAWHVDGRASLVYGTHTHVPTADERVFPRGTGFVTDVGMVGARDSVIGVAPETALPGYLNAKKTRFTWPETGIARVYGIVADVDPKTGHTTSIQRITQEVDIA